MNGIMVNTKVKLGPKAGSFYDPLSKVLVRKGEIVELTPDKMMYPKVRNALNGGHLIMAVEIPVKEEEIPVKEEVSLKDKYINLYKKGDDLSKVFSLKELKQIASEFEIEVESTDTKTSIIEAINEEIK